MSNRPFRFVHASDFHLERLPSGVTEVPDHLLELFIDAGYRAAERVFQAAVAEQAEFLVLSGDVLDAQLTGPRGPLFLFEQFQRLAEQRVAVYWAGGRVDPPDAWPSEIELPENVHVFHKGRPEEFVHQRDELPLARLVGTGKLPGRSIKAADFDPDPGGLFSISVAYGLATADALKDHQIDYWALGGNHARGTLFSTDRVAHYPGTPQGRRPTESGPHGATLVEIDDRRQTRTSTLPCDVMRWHDERVVVDETTTPDELDSQIRRRMRSLVDGLSSVDLLVSWTVGGSGPLLDRLREGSLAAELLATLRKEFGFGPTAAWSVSLEAEAASVLPPQFYEQQTILGDFLRELRHYQMNPEEPLELESLLSEQQTAGTLGSAVAVAEKGVREKVLREAAVLGVDLLNPEEPLS